MIRIETPKISTFLLEEFMNPHNLSVYKLAKEINVPTSHIQDILHDKQQITADTSIRLGRFFNVSDRFFLNLQNDIDLRNLKEEKQSEYNKIVPTPLR